MTSSSVAASPFMYTEVCPPEPSSQFEFTENGYGKILDFAAEHYTFVPFGSHAQSPSLLWRHDVDMSVHRALALSQLEFDRGLAASYFIRLHSEYYNAFEWPIRRKIQEISARGHAIGLHFEADPRLSFPDEDFLEEKLEEERAILEGLAEVEVTAVSFHDPHMGDLLRFRRETYAGMANAYAYLGEAGYVYVSDSNGYWRFRGLSDVLAENIGRNVHVLTHPEWWTPEALPPRARMQRCTDGRAAAIKQLYDTLLDQEGRVNVR